MPNDPMPSRLSNHGRIIREKLRHGEPTIGGWVQVPHPAVATLLASSGLDWVALDLEHAAIDLAQAAVLLQTIRQAGSVPLVRLAHNDYARTKQFMDAGAEGVIVPMVITSEDVQRVIDSVKYPPEGKRGVGYCTANLYGFEFAEYFRRANRDSVICLQIEHVEAIRNLDQLLSSSAVDAAFIGPYDLSASMGLTGQFDHPEYVAGLAEFRRACEEHRVAAGIHVVEPDPSEVVRRIEEGYRMIAYSLDVTLLGRACRDGVAHVRSALRRREPAVEVDRGVLTSLSDAAE
jgi:2-dehydro-3-deoxyglucarate aldolase